LGKAGTRTSDRSPCFFGQLAGCLGGLPLGDGLSHLRRYLQRITGYITAIVILFHGDSPWVYAKDRFIETTLGLAFAVLVGMVMESVMKRMKLKLQF
jgi:hypothetical protein